MKEVVKSESVDPIRIRRGIKRFLSEKGASYTEAFIEAQVRRLEAQLRAREDEALAMSKRQRTIWRRQREKPGHTVQWPEPKWVFQFWLRGHVFRRSMIELAFATKGSETWNDVVAWINRRDGGLVEPLSFDQCCASRGDTAAHLRARLARLGDPREFARWVLNEYDIQPQSPDPLYELCTGGP